MIHVPLHTPEILLGRRDAAYISALRTRGVFVYDTIVSQVRDLIASRNPQEKFTDEENGRVMAAHAGGGPPGAH